ncbi:MAG: DNA-binding winged helix-turn-helix (wHTH) protein [Gammaproteobacteria bacterium]|jgi:DNA-binding winged helix-turn-helix (wHTH) protein
MVQREIPYTYGYFSFSVLNARENVSKNRHIEQVWSEVAVEDDSQNQCIVEFRWTIGHEAVETFA